MKSINQERIQVLLELVYETKVRDKDIALCIDRLFRLNLLVDKKEK